MRIISVAMNNDGIRVVTEADDGRIRELVTSVDEGGDFMHWGDVEPEPELETFIAYDGDGKPGKSVEWLNVTFPEAFNLQHSGKWEIEYRDRYGWRYFTGNTDLPDGTMFRARPKPEALS